MKKENVADQKRLKMLSEVEKKAFADRCEVEIDTAASTAPEDVFAHNMDEFKHNMEEQCKNLETMLSVHKNIITFLQNELSKDMPENVMKVYQSELDVRKELQHKCISSMALMQKRIEIVDKVKAWALNNYADLSELNFCINNVLQLPGTSEKIEAIVQKATEGYGK